MKGDGVYWKSETVDISSTDFTFTIACTCVYATGAGNLIVRLGGDSVDRTFAVTAGQFFKCAPSLVRRTGTTATGLVGLTDIP